MAAKAKRAEELKKREKRSKILLAVLGVVFLAVGVFEVPSIMSQLNKKPPPGTTYDPGPSSGTSTSTGLPNVAGSTASTGIEANGQLVNSDVPPAPADGSQLVSFSMFQSKNPFVPQVTDSATTTDTAPPPASTGQGGAATTTTTPTTPTPTTKTTPVVTTVPTTTTTPTTTTATGGIVPPTSTTPTTPTPKPTSSSAPPSPTVSISVNEVVSKVATGGTFPTSSPVFRLAGWTKGSAQIAIVGGSYATGDATLTLKQGVTVTLENTTDGKRYKLLLLSTPSG